MKTELKTKLVLTSVMAGVSTLINPVPMTATPAAIPNASVVRPQLMVSQAALQAIDARTQAINLPGASLKRRWVEEGGPSFVQHRPPVKPLQLNP
jgi:hypothetical protein